MLSWRFAPAKKSLTAIPILAIYSQYIVLIAKESRNGSGTNINKMMQLVIQQAKELQFAVCSPC